MVDLMRLRKHIVENVPDAVVYPKNREDIIALVKYCCEQKIPMYVYGGGSSVTRGVEAVKGGITLDMRKNFNSIPPSAAGLSPAAQVRIRATTAKLRISSSARSMSLLSAS